MSLTYFPVIGTFQALISDSSADVDGNPDTQNISATVTFTPSVNQVHSVADAKVYRLQPIKARTNISDGELKTVDGHTVTLPANSAALGLDELRYTVSFSDVVYDKQTRVIESFTFIAPTGATQIDLATVERVTN